MNLIQDEHEVISFEGDGKNNSLRADKVDQENSHYENEEKMIIKSTFGFIIIITIAFVLLFGFVVWFAYDQGQEDIVNLNVSSKIKMETVYNNTETAKSENIDSKPNIEVITSEPIENEDNGVVDGKSETQIIENNLENDDNIAENKEEKNEDITNVKEVAEVTSNAVEPIEKSNMSQARESIDSIIKSNLDNNTSIDNLSGSYLVQIGSYKSRTEAYNAWQKFNNNNSNLFSPFAMDIDKADLGEKGVFHRLRVSSFATKAQADEFCNILKNNSINCFVVRR